MMTRGQVAFAGTVIVGVCAPAWAINEQLGNAGGAAAGVVRFAVGGLFGIGWLQWRAWRRHRRALWFTRATGAPSGSSPPIPTRGFWLVFLVSMGSPAFILALLQGEGLVLATGRLALVAGAMVALAGLLGLAERRPVGS